MQIKTKIELINALLIIEEFASNGVMPIIQFCMHGDKTKGLLIVGSEEYMSWSELIVILRKINIKAKNNLCVISSACESYHMIKLISVIKPVPFHTLIAPSKTVDFGFVDDKLSVFYRKILETSDLNEAYNDISLYFESFNCERVFAVAIGQYIKYDCRGKNIRERQERLTTIALSFEKEKSKRNLKHIRKEIKLKIKPTQEFIDKYANIFLINIKNTITLDEIMRVIRNEKT